MRDGGTLRRGFGALALWAATICAQAADWYQVEVIAFRYPPAATASWAAATALPDFSQATRLAPKESAAPTAGTPLAYAELPPTLLHLTGAYLTLSKHGGYQVLFHTGWRQSETDSRAVYLTDQVSADASTAPVANPQSIEGTLRLQSGAKQYRITTQFIAHQNDLAVAIGEVRNVVPGELHYFDHALLGMLVEVTPLDANGEPLPPATEVAPDAPATTKSAAPPTPN